MKYLLVLCAVLFLSSSAWTQPCEQTTMLEPGLKWEVTDFNKRGKAQGKNRYEILETGQKEGGYSWKIALEIFDKKGNLLSESTTNIRCEDGVLNMSMEQFTSPGSYEGLEDMDVEVDASEIQYPTNAKVGTTLPDANVTVKAGSGGMTIVNIETLVEDRKIVAQENIETEVGDFDCVVLEQKTTVKNKILNIESSGKEWYLPGFGVVRSESYNKRDKLTGYREITSLERP
ncbi:MAG: hypothetical protein ACQERC_13500 [Bacteroidota bacterium]